MARLTTGAILDSVQDNLARKAALEDAARKAFRDSYELETRSFLARAALMKAIAELAAWKP